MDENLLNTEIPEKFKDPETGGIKMDALVQSYKELEKKLSTRPHAPNSPEDYCIDCNHGLFEPDAEVNKRMHDMGLSPEQAQAVYDLAAEKLVPIIMEMKSEFEADREVEKLINHFGGAEKWKEVSRQLLAFGQKNLPEDVLHNLSSSYEGVLALHRMMKSEEPGLKKDGEASAQTALDEQELQSMMRDPKYWRDKDPAHVTKVTEGFKKIYGN